MEIDDESINKNNNNEIYQKLEQNKLISYEIKTNNKITKEFTLTETEKECFSIIMKNIKKAQFKFHYMSSSRRMGQR